ncbi:hypothetical protein VNO78_28397 [Psophocarpus tetragonolobus]|uniref:Uncharacterized protein n=1 Tax=Psophocarpus tetragonolobus TaxID=3891 RepID=A0AAN9S4M2_PSOTE
MGLAPNSLNEASSELLHLIIKSDLSSVGRAEDCSGENSAEILRSTFVANVVMKTIVERTHRGPPAEPSRTCVRDEIMRFHSLPSHAVDQNNASCTHQL